MASDLRTDPCPVIARSPCGQAIQSVLAALDCFAALAMTVACSLHPRGLARVAGELQDMQPGVGAVDDVDIAALVGLDIVGLDRGFAAILAVDRDAASVRRSRDRGDEIPDFPGVIGIADV